MQTRNTPETPFTKLKRSREIWINGSASFQTMLKLLADTSCHEACIRSFGLEVKLVNGTSVRGTSDAWQKWFAEYHPQGDETYKTFKYNYLKKDKTEKGLFTLRNADEEFPLDGTKLRKLYGYGTKSKWVRVPVADEPITKPESPFAKPDPRTLPNGNVTGAPGAGLDADEETAIALAVLSSNSPSPASITEPLTPTPDNAQFAPQTPTGNGSGLPSPNSKTATRVAKRKTPVKTPRTPKTPKTPKSASATPKSTTPRTKPKRTKLFDDDFASVATPNYEMPTSLPVTPNIGRPDAFMDSPADPYKLNTAPIALVLPPLEQKNSFLVTPPGAKYPHLVTCSFKDATELLSAIMCRSYTGECFQDRAENIVLVITDHAGIPQYVLDKDTDVQSMAALSGQQKICVRMEWKAEPSSPPSLADTCVGPQESQLVQEEAKRIATTPVVTFSAVNKAEN